MVYQIEKILTLESLKCQMWFFSTFCWVLPEYMRLVIIILPSLFCHQPPPTPTPQAYFPGFLLSFTVHTPSLPNKAINTTSANLVDTTKTIHLGLLIKKKTQRNRIFDWNTCGGRGSLLLSHACLWVALVNIKKENCTDWKSQIYLRAALGVILVAGSHSRHRRMKSVNRGSSQPDIYVYFDNWLLILVWLWKEKMMNFLHLWGRSVVPLIRGAPLAYHVATWWNIPSLESNIGQSRE